MYIRKKSINGKEYYYLVEGKLVDGKVKQKVLAYIGNKEKLEKLYNVIGKRLSKDVVEKLNKKQQSYK